MTRLEKLGIDLNTVEGLTKLMNISCENIGDGYNDFFCTDDLSCEECKAKRLLSGIPTKKVKRWITYKTVDGGIDFCRAAADCENRDRSCGLCRDGDCIKCESDWLNEEIEVEKGLNDNDAYNTDIQLIVKSGDQLFADSMIKAKTYRIVIDLKEILHDHNWKGILYSEEDSNLTVI